MKNNLYGKDNNLLSDRKTDSEMLQMNESTISRSINKLIQRRIILKDETHNAYHLSIDGKEFDAMLPNEEFL